MNQFVSQENQVFLIDEEHVLFRKKPYRVYDELYKKKEERSVKIIAFLVIEI